MKGQEKPGVPGEEIVNQMGFMALLAVLNMFFNMLREYGINLVEWITAWIPGADVQLQQENDEELQDSDLSSEMEEEDIIQEDIGDMREQITNVYGDPNLLDTSGITIVDENNSEDEKEGTGEVPVLTPVRVNNKEKELNGDSSEDEVDEGEVSDLENIVELKANRGNENKKKDSKKKTTPPTKEEAVKAAPAAKKTVEEKPKAVKATPAAKKTAEEKPKAVKAAPAAKKTVEEKPKATKKAATTTKKTTKEKEA